MGIENDLKLIKILWADVEQSIAELNEINSSDPIFGYKSRAYIKALTSWIEGGIYIFKKMLSNAEGGLYKKLPLECQLYLFEYDWKIENGLPKETLKKIATKENLKAYFKVVSLIFDEYQPDLLSKGWNEILFVYQLRDGIMHPKEINDY